MSTTIEVTLQERGSFIELRTYPSNFLLPNGRISIPATVKIARRGTEDRSVAVTFELKDPIKSKLWVNLTQEGNTATVTWREPSESEITTVYSGHIEKRPSEIEVVARATVDGQPIESSVAIRMGRAEKFQLLDVKLNLMDGRSVSDLYGAVTDDEYYVMTVRLFNNLKDPDTKEYIGTSILAYSSSIEMAVQLEKKYDAKTGSYFDNVIPKGRAREIAKNRGRAAADLAEAEANALKAFAENPEGGAKARLQAAYEAEWRAWLLASAAGEKANALRTKAFETRSEADRIAANEQIKLANAAQQAAADAVDNTIRIRDEIFRSAEGRAPMTPSVTSAMSNNTAIDDGLWHPVTNSDLDRIAPYAPSRLRRGDFLAELTKEEFNLAPIAHLPTTVPEPEPACRGAIKYRPLTFEMMVNTVDRRDGRSKRSVFFKLLEAVGTTTSFITAIAVPGSSSDLPLGLEKYRNLLIPGLDRLFPSLKEQQRQNIVSQTMKEIEEIPFGSDITRVVFVPKKSIRGLIRGHESRISEVCPYYFKVEVAIIQKGGTVQTGSITR